MKIFNIAIVLTGLVATPALALEEAPEKSCKCEMMHDGKKMQGMMVKDKDGKMTCRMMDHSHMDHGKKKDAPAEKPDAPHKHD